MSERDHGHIKVHRRLLDWEWFGDSNTVHVLLYLLLKANWQSKRWMGHEIAPGSLVTSRETIAEACGLSAKQARLALERLNRADVITTSRAGQGQLVTLRNWAEYQLSATEEGRPRADRRAGAGPSEGRPRAATKEGKKGRREEGNNPEGLSASADSLFAGSQDGHEAPPVTAAPPPAQDQRDPGVQAVLDHLTDRLQQTGIAQSLDGPAKDNRFMASHLLRKLAKDYPDFDPVASAKRLIDFATVHAFHGPKCTKVGYLFRNLGTLAAEAKAARNGSPKHQTDEQYRDEVIRIFHERQAARDRQAAERAAAEAGG